ncbi:MAG: hypothetical protein AD742_06945 [Methylibium sp. NZG]|nr:MAG: hypothetical protein AD742_06945 [Methylibium sp. NZG]
MQVAALAALVRAVARLRPAGPLDPALVAALADLLLQPTEPEPKRGTARPPAEARDTARRTGERASAALPQTPTPRPASEAWPGAGARPPAAQRRSAQDDNKLVGLVSSLTQVAERADLAAPRSGTARSAAPTPPTAAEAQGSAAPLESLFPTGRVRAILRDLSIVATPSGPIDVAAAVAMVARAEPIQALPRLVRSALGHTILLLFDAGPAMLPFARDKQQLSATALRLLGKDRVRVADFIGDPGQGVRAQRQVRWEPLRWPGRGSTILVVSDLGIGAGRPNPRLDDDPWTLLLDEADRRGLRSVALIPYDRPRWPPVAARFDVALTWDLATGVQALRRLRRPSHSARTHR